MRTTVEEREYARSIVARHRVRQLRVQDLCSRTRAYHRMRASSCHCLLVHLLRRERSKEAVSLRRMCGEQEQHHIPAPKRNGGVKRRGPAAVARAQVRAKRDQEADERRVVALLVRCAGRLARGAGFRCAPGGRSRVFHAGVRRDRNVECAAVAGVRGERVDIRIVLRRECTSRV